MNPVMKIKRSVRSSTQQKLGRKLVREWLLYSARVKTQVFGGRGVPPAYNVLAGETPAPQSVFKNWVLTRAEYN